MKGVVLYLTLILSLSCSSQYSRMNMDDVVTIKVSKFVNYYEQEPYSVTCIMSKDDISRITRSLKFLLGDGVEHKDYHDFKMSKISVEFLFEDNVAKINIIGDRVELKSYVYYPHLSWFERRFVALIKSY